MVKADARGPVSRLPGSNGRPGRARQLRGETSERSRSEWNFVFSLINDYCDGLGPVDKNEVQDDAGNWAGCGACRFTTAGPCIVTSTHGILTGTSHGLNVGFTDDKTISRLA